MDLPEHAFKLPFEPTDDDLIEPEGCGCEQDAHHTCLHELLDDDDDVPGLLLKPSEVIESMERRMFEACIEREQGGQVEGDEPLEARDASGNLIDISDLLPIWQTSKARCLGCGKRWVAVHVHDDVVRCPYCETGTVLIIRVDR